MMQYYNLIILRVSKGMDGKILIEYPALNRTKARITVLKHLLELQKI